MIPPPDPTATEAQRALAKQDAEHERAKRWMKHLLTKSPETAWASLLSMLREVAEESRSAALAAAPVPPATLTKADCDACPDCGPLVMCGRHSRQSETAERETTRYIEGFLDGQALSYCEMVNRGVRLAGMLDVHARETARLVALIERDGCKAHVVETVAGRAGLWIYRDDRVVTLIDAFESRASRVPSDADKWMMGKLFGYGDTDVLEFIAHRSPLGLGEREPSPDDVNMLAGYDDDSEPAVPPATVGETAEPGMVNHAETPQCPWMGWHHVSQCGAALPAPALHGEGFAGLPEREQGFAGLPEHLQPSSAPVLTLTEQALYMKAKEWVDNHREWAVTPTDLVQFVHSLASEER